MSWVDLFLLDSRLVIMILVVGHIDQYRGNPIETNRFQPNQQFTKYSARIWITNQMADDAQNPGVTHESRGF